MNIHSLAGNSPTFLNIARLRGKKTRIKTKTRRPLPRLVFFKKKEKNRTSCRRLHRMETTPLQVDAVPWESAGRSGILPLLHIGKALQRLKRSLLSMPKYYTIFVEIARCGFIQPAINVTQHFVEIAQLSTQRPYKKPRRVQNTPGQKTCGL